MRKIMRIFCCATLGGMISCAQPTGASEILAITLEKYCDADNKLVLQSSTIGLTNFDVYSKRNFGMLNDGTKELGDLHPEALSDAYSRNVGSSELTVKCDSLLLLTEKEIQEAFENKPTKPFDLLAGEQWAGFLEGYPDVTAILRVSLPGYSRDGQHAIIFESIECEPLCGSSFFSQYKKIENKWIREKKLTVGKN